MSGASDGGFTLLEVVVALVIVSVAFTVLLEFLSDSARRLEEAERTFEDVLLLDSKLKRGDHEGLEVKRKRLPDFPSIKEAVYRYGEVFFVRYEAR